MAYDIGPKIGIEGEAEYRKAINQISTSMKTMGTELTAITSAYAKNDKSVENLTQQNKVLTKQIELQTEKVLGLRQGLDAAKQKYGENSEVTQKWQQNVNRAVAELNKLDRQVKENCQDMSGMKQATEDIAQGFKEAGDEALQFCDVLNANVMSDLIVETSKKMAQGLKNIGMSMLEFGTNFEDSLAKASTLFGGVKVNMEGLQDKILAVSNKTGKAASEIGESLYSALSAGIPVTEDMGIAMKFLESSTKLAKAGFTDVDTVVNSTAKVLNAYKMDVDETADVHKILMQVQNKGITTVGELGASLAQVTPTAAAMSVAFEQVGAALASMTAQGTPTAQATTQLNSLFAELGKSGTVAQKSLAAATQNTAYAGKGFQQLMQEGIPLNTILDLISSKAAASGKSMLDMFSSIEAGRAALALSGTNSKQFADNLAAMATEADVVTEAYDKVSNTLSATFDKMKNQLNNKLIEIFDDAKDTLGTAMKEIGARLEETLNSIDTEAVAQTIIRLTNSLMTLGKFIVENASAIATALTTIGVAFASLKVASTVTGMMKLFKDNMKETGKSWAALGAAFKTNPFGLIVVAIAAVVTGLITLWNTNEDFRNGIIKIWDSIKGVFAGIASFFADTIPAAFNAVLEFVQSNWQGLLLLLVNPFVGAFKLFYDNCESFRTFIGSFIENIKQFFVVGWQGIVSFFTESIPTFIASVSEWFSQIPYRIGEIMGLVVAKFLEWGLNLGAWVMTQLPVIISNIVNWFAQLPERIYEWLLDSTQKLATWGVDMSKRAADTGAAVVNNVVNWFAQMPGKIWEWLKSVVQKVVNWNVDMATKASIGAQNVFTVIVDWFAQLPAKMVEIGKNAIQGLLSGISSMAQKVVKTVGNFVQGFKDGFTNAKALDVHSPSKWAYQVGAWVIEGFVGGLKDNQSKAAQAAAETSKNIMSAAQKLMDRAKYFNQITAKEELAFWEGLVNIGKLKGEDLEELNKKIFASRAAASKEMFDNSSHWIDEQKFYNKLSAEEEVAAWERVTQKEGLLAAEREQAEKSLYTAKQKLMEQDQKALEEYQNNLETRTNSIKNFAGLFDNVEKDSNLTGNDLLNNLRGQVDTLETWQNDLQALADKGIAGDLMQQLLGMGPKAAEEIHQLTMLSPAEMEEYIDLFTEKSKLAVEQAKKEIGAFNVPLVIANDEETVETNLETLTLAAVATMETMKQGMADNMVKISDVVIIIANSIITTMNGFKESFINLGKNVVDNIWDGMKSQKSGLINNIVSMLEDAVRAAREAMDIHSPSRVWAGIGENMAAGLGVGFCEQMRTVVQQINASIPIPTIGTSYAAAAKIGEGVVNAVSAVGASPANNNPIILQVNLDGREMAKATFDPLKGIAKQRGVSLG